MVAHEIAHAVDALAGDVPTRGLADDLGRIYNDLNQQDWRLAKQEAGGEPVAARHRMTPEIQGYGRGDVRAELWAKAIRAYMTDPNYIKTVAPKVAARIRAYVNASPRLKDIIQFNGAALPATGAALGGAAERAFE